MLDACILQLTCPSALRNEEQRSIILSGAPAENRFDLNNPYYIAQLMCSKTAIASMHIYLTATIHNVLECMQKS